MLIGKTNGPFHLESGLMKKTPVLQDDCQAPLLAQGLRKVVQIPSQNMNRCLKVGLGLVDGTESQRNVPH